VETEVQAEAKKTKGAGNVDWWPCRSSSGFSLASHRGGPGSRPGSMWGLWWTKRHWGTFSPSTSVSLANHHSTNLSIIIITRGWHNRPISGRSAEWTQLDSVPALYQFNFFYVDWFIRCIWRRKCIWRGINFFFNLRSGGWNQGPLDTAAT
jgi:hypothetical protein